MAATNPLPSAHDSPLATNQPAASNQPISPRPHATRSPKLPLVRAKVVSINQTETQEGQASLATSRSSPPQSSISKKTIERASAGIVSRMTTTMRFMPNPGWKPPRKNNQ